MIRKIADFVALFGAIAGSALVAANMGLAVFGYVAFLASSIASVYLLFKTKDAPRSLMLQNLFFIGVNVFGLIRHGA